MSKKLLRFTVVVLCGLLLNVCGLAHAADIKIAYVNMQQVIKKSAAGKEMSTVGNQIIQKKRAEIGKLEEEISKMFDEYKEKEMVLSTNAKKEIKDKIERKMIDKDRFEKDSYRDVRNFEKKVVSEIVVDVNKIIKQIGQDEGYTLILDSTGEKKGDTEISASNILYATPEMDITTKIISLYDKQYVSKKK